MGCVFGVCVWGGTLVQECGKKDDGAGYKRDIFFSAHREYGLLKQGLLFFRILSKESYILNGIFQGVQS